MYFCQHPCVSVSCACVAPVSPFSEPWNRGLGCVAIFREPVDIGEGVVMGERERGWLSERVRGRGGGWGSRPFQASPVHLSKESHATNLGISLNGEADLCEYKRTPRAFR